jgi:hypothetical protein
MPQTDATGAHQYWLPWPVWTPTWLHAVFRPTDFRLTYTPSRALTSQRQALELEQRFDETVAMEMVSGDCVGQGREGEGGEL